MSRRRPRPDLADGGARAGRGQPPPSTARGWKSVGPAPPAIAAPIAALPAFSHDLHQQPGEAASSRARTEAPPSSRLENSPRRESSLAVDPRDPNVVYVGWLQVDRRRRDLELHGGRRALSWSWIRRTRTSSMALGGDDSEDHRRRSDLVSRRGRRLGRRSSLAISPFNTNVLYAGHPGEGAFKSVDGGASWTPDRHRLDRVVASGRSEQRQHRLCRYQRQRRVQEHRRGRLVRASRIAEARHRLLARQERRQALRRHRRGRRVGEPGRRGDLERRRAWRKAAASRSAPTAPARSISGRTSRGRSCFRRIITQSARANRRRRRRQRRQDSKWRRLGWKQLKRLRLPEWARGRDRSLGSRARLLRSRRWASRDRGRRPDLVGRQPPWLIGGRARRRGVFDPQQPRRVYAGSVGDGFFKSVDHGKHWVTPPVRGRQPDLPSPWPSIRSTIRCTWGPCSADGIWKSTDFGDTFTRIDRAPDAPPGEFLDLSGRGITVDPNNHNTVYFADRGTGIWRSQDAGASWVNVDPTQAQNVTVDPTDSQHRLRRLPVRRRAQEHRRRRVIHRKEQRPAGSHAHAARRRRAREPGPPQRPLCRSRVRRGVQEHRRRRSPGCRSVWASTASG